MIRLDATQDVMTGNVTDNEESTTTTVHSKDKKTKSHSPDLEKKSEKYLRDTSISSSIATNNNTTTSSKSTKKIISQTKDKKLRAELKKSQEKFKNAAVSAARAEILLTEDAGFLEPTTEMERTWKFTQKDLKQHVDIATKDKMINLNLPDFGPYVVDYTRNGRHMLMAGKKGHVAVMDTLRNTLKTEFHLHQEKCTAATFLHNSSMFAVAQNKFTHIYESASGAEVHVLRDGIVNPSHLTFLPYHYLLASVGRKGGMLQYRDVSTGSVVATHKAKQGVVTSMSSNPWNAVIHLGSGTGIVSLWTPNMTDAVVKIQCHKGPVTAIAVHTDGRTMVTAGLDRQLKVWDLRNNYEAVHSYGCTTPASSLDISQRKTLAVGYGPNVSIWKDFSIAEHKANAPYMNMRLPGSSVTSVRFQPYEDVCTIGTTNGISTMIVPGSGEPNVDTFVANPYEDKKQRQETEVRSLLEKLQPEMITLNPMVIGRVDENAHEENFAKKSLAALVNEGKPLKIKNKKRGRSKIGNRMRKKQFNVVDAERQLYRDRLEAQEKERNNRKKNSKKKKEENADNLIVAKEALMRFKK